MDRHLISTEATLLEALRKLNDLSGGAMTLFAVDSNGCVHGSVTDGDIRRALLGGATMLCNVTDIMHRDFRKIDCGKSDVESVRECRLSGIRLLPVVDCNGVLTDIIDLSRQHSILPLSAIVMAGGKGERLRPMTVTTPKPLLEIGGKAIIDYNIEALARCGITDISVTVNYLADKLKEHFSQPVAGVYVKCVEEEAPLGTIGAASLCQIPEHGNTLVMNSDLLTTISFEDMYIHHVSSGSDITVAAIPYQVSVPYAILTSDDDGSKVTGIEEKPTYSYFANAGIYIFRNDVLRGMRRGVRTDATELIENAISDNRKVTRFPINGTWIDVGTPADFRQATELIRFLHQNRK